MYVYTQINFIFFYLVFYLKQNVNILVWLNDTYFSSGIRSKRMDFFSLL